MHACACSPHTWRNGFPHEPNKRYAERTDWYETACTMLDVADLRNESDDSMAFASLCRRDRGGCARKRMQRSFADLAQLSRDLHVVLYNQCERSNSLGVYLSHACTRRYPILGTCQSLVLKTLPPVRIVATRRIQRTSNGLATGVFGAGRGFQMPFMSAYLAETLRAASQSCRHSPEACCATHAQYHSNTSCT